MPSWIASNLLLIGKIIVGAVLILGYTTITGMGGYYLHSSINLAFQGKWKSAWWTGLYGIAAAAGVLALIYIRSLVTISLIGRAELAALGLPYVLGFFGRFIVLGEGE